MKSLINLITSPRWIFKRALGFILGSLNLAGIYASVKLVKSGVLRPFIASLEHWLLAPLHVNLAILFKLGISASLYLAGLPLRLLSLLVNHILGSDAVNLGWIADALRTFLERLIPAPSWAGISLVSPVKILPFGDSIFPLIHTADQALAILLAVLVTAALTSITFVILQQDLPESFQANLNRRSSVRAYQEIKALKNTLEKIDFLGLPNSRENQTLAEVSGYFLKLNL